MVAQIRQVGCFKYFLQLPHIGDILGMETLLSFFWQVWKAELIIASGSCHTIVWLGVRSLSYFYLSDFSLLSPLFTPPPLPLPPRQHFNVSDAILLFSMFLKMLVVVSMQVCGWWASPWGINPALRTSYSQECGLYPSSTPQQPKPFPRLAILCEPVPPSRSKDKATYLVSFSWLEEPNKINDSKDIFKL